MSIADNALQRQAWLARVARIKLELEDLRIEVDVAMRQARQPFATVKRLAMADVHIERATTELNDAGAQIGGLT